MTKQEGIMLNKARAEFSFNDDGSVCYFSIPTQWSSANTLEEAVDCYLSAYKEQDGLSSLGYLINKYEKENKE